MSHILTAFSSATLLAQSGVADSSIPEPTIWHWLIFGVFVVIVLTLDLVVFHRHAHEPTLRESAAWTLVWCSLALGFNALIWAWRGPEMAVLFLTGYLVEWSLSMDNVFVFAVVFAYFGVPLKYQYRVLFWGILGAVAMRLSFILLGSALLRHFDWVLWIFGVFLVYTAYKLARQGDEEVDPSNNIAMRFAKRFLPIAKESHGDHFFVIENGRRAVTPLFLVLLVIETTDVMFAVDSVPAIFGITKDTFTVFTSNIFAILGLRALYFLLAGVMDMFRYLKYGLSAVLAFVGLKMIGDYWLTPYLYPHEVTAGGEAVDHHLIHPALSLVIIMSLLGISIVASIVAKRREERQNLPEIS